MDKKKIRRYILAVVCVAVLSAGIYLKMTPGPIRYYGLPEAMKVRKNSVMFEIGGTEYVWHGPWEDDMKKGRLIAYLKDDDGYYCEFYEVKGRDDMVIVLRRVIMGDQYVVKVREPDQMEKSAAHGN